MAEIIDMTRRMQQLAAELNWDELLVLQTSRQERVLAFFTEPVADDDSVWIAAAVGEILQADRQMEAACRQAYENVSGQLSGIAQGNKAKQAYQQP